MVFCRIKHTYATRMPLSMYRENDKQAHRSEQPANPRPCVGSERAAMADIADKIATTDRLALCRFAHGRGAFAIFTPANPKGIQRKDIGFRRENAL